MIATQREFQASMGYDFASMGLEMRVEYIKDMTLAAVRELFELLDETSWKPWATGTYVNRAKAFGELVDAWHFFMNLALALCPNATPDDVARMLTDGYHEKQEINRQRQRDGYDGVSTKCTHCGRALDEPNAFALVEGDPHLEGWGRCLGFGCGVYLAPKLIEGLTSNRRTSS
jgi:hypothetical protein